MEQKVNPMNADPTVGNPVAGTGTAGLETQLGGQATTVSGVQMADGMGGEHLIQPDIDEQLFKFSSDDTPLMNLMLKAKKIMVNSPEVDHYMIDEPDAVVKTTAVTGAGALTFDPADAGKIHPYDCLSVKGSDNGHGRPIQLFVTEVEETSGTVKVLCDNYNVPEGSNYGTLTANNSNIPVGTSVIILGNALYETQKIVPPDTVLPRPTRVYLQKRGMNQVVSDYFNSQSKRIPFTEATIAEAAIRNFKVKGNRTLWIGQKSKMRVDSKNDTGKQFVYKTEGVRWQFLREVKRTTAFTYEFFIGLAKMFYTGEDVPSTCLGLCGKNFLEKLQTLDWSNHPEITMSQQTNGFGWSVTNIHTAFGDLQFKHEPTLDRIGCSNSCALIDPSRLVHYQRTAEHSFNEAVEGEEAKRNGILVWDALCLKGSCHIWVDGENYGSTAPNATEFVFWNGESLPTSSTGTTGVVYVLEITYDDTHVAGTAWKLSSAGTLERYNDMVYAE